MTRAQQVSYPARERSYSTEFVYHHGNPEKVIKGLKKKAYGLVQLAPETLLKMYRDFSNLFAIIILSEGDIPAAYYLCCFTDSGWEPLVTAKLPEHAHMGLDRHMNAKCSAFHELHSAGAR